MIVGKPHIAVMLVWPFGALRMTKLRTALSALAILAFMPSTAHAWGSEGHRIIAHLAYEQLTPKAKAEVAGLIAHSSEQGTPSCPIASLEDAATWPDCIRPLHGRWKYLAVDHFEDVPVCQAPGGWTIDASASPTRRLDEVIALESALPWCENGNCTVAETAKAELVLKDRSRSAADRLEALEEISHFVGDMHQPLHAADNHDRGGIDVKVQVNGHASNLHHVWDTEVLENAVGKDEAAAEAVLRPLVQQHARTAAEGDLHDWLMQSHALAQTYVYFKLPQSPVCGVAGPPQDISQAYLDGAAPIVREQLAKASIRLAAVLNGLLN